MSSELPEKIRLCFIQGLRAGRIRRLSGFSKQLGHKEPDVLGDRESAFVAQVGHAEVMEETERILGRIRQEFGYRRKEVSTTQSEGAVSVMTPDFELRVWVAQDGEDAGAYQRWIEVASLKQIAFFSDPRFLAVFGDYCNRMVVELEDAMDMEALIDRIEEQEGLARQLDYPSDLSWCRLKFIQPIMEICMEPRRIVFQNGPGEGLGSLVDGSMKAMSLMGVDGSGSSIRD